MISIHAFDKNKNELKLAPTLSLYASVLNYHFLLPTYVLLTIFTLLQCEGKNDDRLILIIKNSLFLY